MRRIVRIAQEVRAPAPLHGGVFVGEAPGFRGSEIAPAAGRLMVDQLGGWCPHIEITGRPDPQTKIDIIESDRQGLVEPADLIEYVAANEQTCRGNSADVLHHA